MFTICYIIYDLKFTVRSFEKNYKTKEGSLFKWSIVNEPYTPLNKYLYFYGISSLTVVKNMRIGFSNSLSDEFSLIKA
jgi:hypothetical protein